MESAANVDMKQNLHAEMVDVSVKIMFVIFIMIVEIILMKLAPVNFLIALDRIFSNATMVIVCQWTGNVMESMIVRIHQTKKTAVSRTRFVISRIHYYITDT